MIDTLAAIKEILNREDAGNNPEAGNRYNEDFKYFDFHQDRLNYLFFLLKNYFKPGDRFLDIGSLFGYNCLGAKLIGYEAAGTDLPKYVTSFAHRFQSQGIDNRAADLKKDAIPFADESFDVVLASEVLEHFNFHPARFLAEVARVLRPGGRLILTTPNLIRLNNVFKMILGQSINWDIKDDYWDGAHHREFTAGELVELLKQSGLHLDNIVYRNFNYPNISGPIKMINAALGMILTRRRGNLIVIATK
jgi:SAM-dependent methyltransferase